MGEGDTLFNAALGAVVTVLLSFTGFSPLLGGGLAGYLQREDRTSGAKVGAVSGVLATLPLVLFLFLFFGLFLAGMAGVPMMGGGTGLPGGVGLVAVFVLVPLLFLWNAGLGAVGGYLGAYIREEQAPGERDGSASN